MTLGRRAKIGLIVGALAMAQLGLLLAYRAAERGNSARRVFVAEGVPATLAPRLVVDRRGDRGPLRFASAPTIVHFWATWCGPCREELPELLTLAEDERLGVSILAISVDETWEVVDHFFGGRAPRSVMRAPRDEVRATFGVERFPESFLVDAHGVLRARLPGAQPWTSAQAREWLASIAGDAR